MTPMSRSRGSGRLDKRSGVIWPNSAQRLARRMPAMLTLGFCKARSRAFSRGFLVLEGDAGAVAGDQPAVGDGDPMAGLPCARALLVNSAYCPFGSPSGRGEARLIKLNGTCSRL